MSTSLTVNVPILGFSEIARALICGHFLVQLQKAQVAARAVCATWWLRAGICTVIRLKNATIEAEAI